MSKRLYKEFKKYVYLFCNILVKTLTTSPHSRHVISGTFDIMGPASVSLHGERSLPNLSANLLSFGHSSYWLAKFSCEMEKWVIIAGCKNGTVWRKMLENCPAELFNNARISAVMCGCTLCCLLWTSDTISSHFHRSLHLHHTLQLSACELAPDKHSYLRTYSMEQSPSWEANWFCS